MTDILIFKIKGEPKPQARPRATRHGNFARVYSPLSQWRLDVMTAAQQQYKGDILSGPLICSITYYFKRPLKHYGTGKNADNLKKSAPEFMTIKPDLDNLDKAILDALVDAQILQDDSIIFTKETTKYWADKGDFQGVIIRLTPGDDYDYSR